MSARSYRNTDSTTRHAHRETDDDAIAFADKRDAAPAPMTASIVLFRRVAGAPFIRKIYVMFIFRQPDVMVAVEYGGCIARAALPGRPGHSANRVASQSL